MPISINNNLMANSVSDNLNRNYGKLSTSVQRLSSGLRINSAADDAAGLAIRELMRADVAALHQGVRNANDAISMIQVADGALGIIDEKLIRMKELAEQAATGTYDSTQRLMIDSEFQAMASEIDRIARATDFNGIKLLDGSLSGAHDGRGLNSTGKMKIHFGSGNDSAEDYYYVDIGDCTTAGLGLRSKLSIPQAPTLPPQSMQWITEAEIDMTNRKIILDISGAYAGSSANAFAEGLDYYSIPVGLENVIITSNSVEPKPAHKSHVSLFTNTGRQLTGMPIAVSKHSVVVDGSGYRKDTATATWWNDLSSADFVDECKKAGVFSQHVDAITMQGDPMQDDATVGAMQITQITGQNEIGARWVSYPDNPATLEEIIEINQISSDLVFFIGGHDNPADGCNHYNLRIEADITETFLQRLQTGFAGESSGESFGDLIHVDTQEKAQKALVSINGAMEKKDTVRAHLGALQNRLENTVTNLTVQAENLQSAESRISDADIGAEMMIFVRNQILTQSSVAMLSQANSWPHMMMSLIGG